MTGSFTAGAGAGRLLVVDDEPTVRELLAETLRFAGYQVAVAADGAGAVATAPLRWRSRT